MAIGITEEHEQLRQQVRRFVETRIPPAVPRAALDAEHDTRPDFWAALCEPGWLALHLAEIVLWTGALVWSRLVSDWRVAAFFAANTYTTLGYGTFVLPPEWNMMAPIIAISGLFTFGWTASVLVDFVRTANRVRHPQPDAHDHAPH